MQKRLSWRKYHKWVGVVFAVFLTVFCVSGIILNHRALVSSCDVNRSWLPSSYHVGNYNNGIVKGTVPLGGGKVAVYGYGGVWITDREAVHWQQMNDGLPQGADHRNVRNLVKTKNGTLWCVTNYDVYRNDGRRWRVFPLDKGDERLMDITLGGDSMQVVALTRSALYVINGTQKVGAYIYNKVERRELKPARDFRPQEYLFRTIWKLHSGELFGMSGRLVVDAVAVVIIVLSITGVVLFLLPYRIRRRKRSGDRDGMKKAGRQLVWQQRWHNRVGRYTIVLTLFLTLTGTCLRPPLMVPFVLLKTAPVNCTQNIWNDRLRALRWDSRDHVWLVSTADGFMRVDSLFSVEPQMVEQEKSPVVSPMGVNVFRQRPDGKWLIGSFSGLSIWDAHTGRSSDYFTRQPPVKSYGVKPGQMTCGYSDDFGKPLVFDYALGVLTPWKEMPPVMERVPLSLWNLALELHVGRCYSPLLGPLSDLFVFVWGTLSVLVLLSGYIILKRRTGRRKSSSHPTNIELIR